MARVPTLSLVPQVLPEAARSPDASLEVFGMSQARALSQASKALGEVGGSIANHAIQEQKLDNEVEIKERLLEFHRATSDADIEFKSLQGSQAMEAFPAYRERMDTLRKEILAKSSNPAVARALDTGIVSHYDNILRSASSHVSTQRREYSRQQNVALLGIAHNKQVNASDERGFEEFGGEVDAMVDKIIKDEGGPPEAAELKKAEYRSKAIVDRLAEMAKTEPFKANSYLDKYSDQIVNPQQRAAIRERIDAHILDEGSRRDAEELKKGRDPLASGGIRDFISQAEGTYGKGPGGSGYNVTLDHGRWLPGGKETVLTDKTINEVLALQEFMLSNPENRAKYGDGKNRGSSAAGRYQIVSTTLRSLVRDMRLTGDEKFDEAMQDRMADVLVSRRGRNAASLRNEWQGLNRRSNEEIYGAYDNGGGGKKLPALTPDIKEAELKEILEHVDKVAAVRAPNSADKYKDRITSQLLGEHRVLKVMHKEEQDAKVNSVLAEIIGEPGSTGITDYNDLSPQTRATLLELPAQTQDLLRRRIDLNSRELEQQPPTLAQIERLEYLRGLWLSNNAEFKKIDLTQEQLPKSFMSKLITMRTTPPKEEKDLRVKSAMGVIADQIKAAKIVTTTDSGRKLMVKLTDRMDAELDKWQAQNPGKRPTDADIRMIGSRLLLSIDTDRSMWPNFEFLGMPPVWSGRGFEMKPEHIPQEDRKGIIDYLKSKGRTDEELVRRPELVLDHWLEIQRQIQEKNNNE